MVYIETEPVNPKNQICANCGHEKEKHIEFIIDEITGKPIKNANTGCSCKKFVPQNQSPENKTSPIRYADGDAVRKDKPLNSDKTRDTIHSQDDEPETAENSHNAVKTVRRRSPDTLRGCGKIIPEIETPCGELWDTGETDYENDRGVYIRVFCKSCQAKQEKTK